VRRIGTSLWLLTLVSVLGACAEGRALTSVPPGAQAVHVIVTGPDVRLEPATVRAGDVYIVMDTPGSGVGFVQQQRDPSPATPGPLTDDDLARLGRGDTQGTSIGGFEHPDCPADQPEGPFLDDHCGHIFVVPLMPGKYAFYTGELESLATDPNAASIAVLEVVP
jgi:hypothetical protein